MQHEDFNILYSEIMYKERDVIEKFLKDQYDIRYGRQRDTWHFEPAIEMIAHQGSHVLLHDMKLDKDKFVVFYVEAFCDKNAEWECTDFAYGELSKVIEALPDADDIVIKNAVNDLSEFSVNLRCDLILQESPFIYKDVKVDNVLKDDGGVHICVGGRALAEEKFDSDFLSKLRDHIHIEHLHRTKEYKEIMKWLALEPNLRKSVDEYDKTHYGLVTFVIEGTDMEFDVSAIQRDDKGNLSIFGADTECEDELITLTDKEIRKEYLAEILKWMKPKYSDIMDTYNSHNPELVRKINAAWKKEKYHDLFGDILYALACRDMDEWEEKYNDIIHDSEDAMNHAHEIMEGVCDDTDLQTILLFIRYDYL